MGDRVAYNVSFAMLRIGCGCLTSHSNGILTIKPLIAFEYRLKVMYSGS